MLCHIPQQQALVPQKRHYVKHAAPCAGRHAAGTGCSRACWVRFSIYRFRHAHPAHDPLAPARPRRSQTLRIRSTRPGGNTPFRSARRYKAEGDAAWIIVLDSILYPTLPSIRSCARLKLPPPPETPRYRSACCLEERAFLNPIPTREPARRRRRRPVGSAQPVDD